jgi:hypothetical protein
MEMNHMFYIWNFRVVIKLNVEVETNSSLLHMMA